MGRREGSVLSPSVVSVARSLLLAAGVGLHTRTVRLLNYGVTARIPQRNRTDIYLPTAQHMEQSSF